MSDIMVIAGAVASVGGVGLLAQRAKREAAHRLADRRAVAQAAEREAEQFAQNLAAFSYLERYRLVEARRGGSL